MPAQRAARKGAQHDHLKNVEFLNKLTVYLF